MKRLFAVALAVPLLAALPAPAQTPTPAPIRIGVLNDLSGVYSDYQGIGSAIAAQMAAEDFGDIAGHKVEILAADHMNKPDVGLSITRQWFDTQNVAMVIDVPNSAIALAVSDLARDKNRVFIGSGAATDALTGPKCTPNTIHWTYDTWEAGHALASAVVARGGKNWFFLTADYAFGDALQGRMSEAVIADGGRVAGAARHPLGTTDFSSMLVSAQNSGATVLGLANAGGDSTAAMQQAKEFGVTPAMKIAGPLININHIDALGLAGAQGVLAVTPFYWDLNDGTRAFARRFAERHPRHIYPNDMQAGVYSAVLHYLKAARQLNGEVLDGAKIVAAMKAMPTDDPLFGRGSIRADGRKIHPVFLIETKTVAASTSKWDMFNIVATIPAEMAFRPLAEGKCPLVGG
jgi:branched-chain amino acid transport system substrate-binding protein